MTGKELLKQYCDLQKEIQELEARIEKTKNRKIKVERDQVKGSSPHFPYEPRTFTVEGYNYPGADKKEELLIKYNNLLCRRKQRCEELKLEIEEFISNIPDSRVRRIFQYRYIDGLEWLPIAMRMNKVHESYPRKIHDRYLESLN